MKRVLTEPEAAEYLGVSIKTMQAWRLTGDGPPFIKYARAGNARAPVRYLRSDLEAFQAEHRFRSTSERLEAAG